MEHHDLLSQCLAMIITVILIARISSCLDNAVLSEVNAPYVDNYVAKSYFNKHDSLVDSKFEDFIAHDILSGACVSLQGNVEFSPQLSALHGKLIGEGSHRRLSSTLRLKMSSESISRPPKSCEVIIVERLPSGVFADPFELQHLVHRGVFRDAAVFGDTNLELPSFLSNRSLVEVHLEVDTNLTSQQKDELEIHMELPLHARYQDMDSHELNLLHRTCFCAAMLKEKNMIRAVCFCYTNRVLNQSMRTLCGKYHVEVENTQKLYLLLLSSQLLYQLCSSVLPQLGPCTLDKSYFSKHDNLVDQNS